MAGACSRDNPCGGSTRNVCAPSTVVQRILPHCQHKAFANGFLSKHLMLHNTLGTAFQYVRCKVNFILRCVPFVW